MGVFVGTVPTYRLIIQLLPICSYLPFGCLSFLYTICMLMERYSLWNRHLLIWKSLTLSSRSGSVPKLLAVPNNGGNKNADPRLTPQRIWLKIGLVRGSPDLVHDRRDIATHVVNSTPGAAVALQQARIPAQPGILQGIIYFKNFCKFLLLRCVTVPRYKVGR